MIAHVAGVPMRQGRAVHLRVRPTELTVPR
jgi:hypothetical protein